MIKFTKIILVIGLFLLSFSFTYAASQKDIDQKNPQIQDIQNRISAIENKKAETEQDKKAKEVELNKLKSEISTLNSEISAIKNKINEVGSQIQEKEQVIQKTSMTIEELEQNLENQKNTIREMVQEVYKQSLLKNEVFNLMSVNSISDMFAQVTYSEQVQTEFEEKMKQAIDHKTWLENEKSKFAVEKSNLDSVKNDLEKQRISAENEKNKTSSQVFSTEKITNQLDANLANLSNEQKQLRDQMNKFYAELARLESQAKQIASANSPLGSIVWPTTSNKCTQGYGMTSFAKTGFYGGQIHNGIDIGGGGNPIFSIADGTVIAKYGGVCGNSYSSCGGGWGNWVAVKHNSGHVSMYAHLSGSASVSVGQSVSQGQPIGKIGNSGFSTGPHLHFSIYDSFKITQNSNPSLSGTLNPLNYYKASCPN